MYRKNPWLISLLLVSFIVTFTLGTTALSAPVDTPWTAGRIGQLPSDPWEPNDTLEQAAPIGILPGPPLSVQATLGNTETGWDGQDYYLFTTEITATVSLTLTIQAGAGEVALAALHENADVMTAVPITSESVSICLGALAPGNYVLRAGLLSWDGVEYTLQVSAGEGAPPCPDPYEPNDTQEGATPIDEVPRFESWLTTSEDTDVYMVTIPAGRIQPGDAGTWEIALTPELDACTLEAAVYGQEGELLANAVAQPGETVYLNVDVQPLTSYYLILNSSDTFDDMCRYTVEHAHIPLEPTATPTPTPTSHITPTPTSTPTPTPTPILIVTPTPGPLLSPIHYLPYMAFTP